MSKGRPPQVIEEGLVKAIASLALLGTSVNAISKQLSVTRFIVQKVMQGEEFKELLQKQADEATAQAKNQFKSFVETLLPDAKAALASLLRSDKGRDLAEGLKAYFRLIGLDDKEVSDAMGNLIINLPGAKRETVIELPKEIDDAGV